MSCSQAAFVSKPAKRAVAKPGLLGRADLVLEGADSCGWRRRVSGLGVVGSGDHCDAADDDDQARRGEGVGQVSLGGFDADSDRGDKERPREHAGAWPVAERYVEADVGDKLGADYEENEARPQYW